MKSANRFAFKEWAVVCAALAEGRQALILRKGGIHEGRDGFHVRHPEFWLFPTYLHQAADSLVEPARPLMETVSRERPPDGTVRLGHYALVADVFEVHDTGRLQALAGEHILSERSVAARFAYREPGLFVLALRIYRAPRVHELADRPHFAGCRSWVDLSEELPTTGAQAVLDDNAFHARLQAIRAALDPHPAAGQSLR